MKQIRFTSATALLIILSLLSACESGVDPTEPVEAVPGQDIPANESETSFPASTVALPTPTSSPAPTATIEVIPTATETPTSVLTAEPTVTSSPGPASRIELLPVATGFESPTFLTHAGDERIFILEKGGRIRIIADGEPAPVPFLDITDRVGSSSSEQGLLSMAFHPNFINNGKFYVNYTNLGGNTIVSGFRVSPGEPNQVDANTEEILLQINQPFANHNGGQIQFGPDGYLYIGMGDGGSQGDPQANGQNPQTFLGAILRLDVDNGSPYTIPADNPYLALEGYAGEIWAIGFRNPWRFSFDRETGDLYIADVGQNNVEEVNFQPALSAGGTNYGWNVMEGSQCYRSDNCNLEGLTLPVAEYSHVAGHCSISGGYVYRGMSYPELQGNYFFGDYCSGTIWSLFQVANGDWVQTVVYDSDIFISSFGENSDGELFVLDFSAGTIYQVTPS